MLDLYRITAEIYLFTTLKFPHATDGDNSFASIRRRVSISEFVPILMAGQFIMMTPTADTIRRYARFLPRLAQPLLVTLEQMQCIINDFESTRDLKENECGKNAPFSNSCLSGWRRPLPARNLI
jgi:hypothetical protein